MHTFVFENIVVDYLWAAARGATNGKTVSFYLGGADRPDFLYMAVDYIREPGRGQARHVSKTSVQAQAPKGGGARPYAAKHPMLRNSASGPEIGLTGRIPIEKASKSAIRPAEGQPEGRF